VTTKLSSVFLYLSGGKRPDYQTCYCYRIHCSTPHASTARSLLQQQAKTPSYSWHHLKLNPLCRKSLQATEWGGGQQHML